MSRSRADSSARARAAFSSLVSVFRTIGWRSSPASSTLGVENTSAAESRIRDVDIASETAILTRNQVMQQAGIAVLAQANVSTQSALALLQ